MKVVLANWLLQMDRIHLNFRFSLKIMCWKLIIYPTLCLTTFVYTCIFKGLFFSLLVFTSQTYFFPFEFLLLWLLLLLCCFCKTALFTWLHTHVWHYLILNIVSLKLPPFCFGPQELSRQNLFLCGPSSPRPPTPRPY